MKSNLSRLIQGCMTWGIWGKDLNTADMTKRIEANVELGVTSFDHADIYGNYTTEAAFGKALTHSSVHRNEIELITKCGIQLVHAGRGTRVKHYNYRASYIIQQAEQSLQNLQTDYLDVFLLHRPSPLMEVDEIKEAITKLQNEGKIKSFGVSNFTPAQIQYLTPELDIRSNQVECSLTHHQPLEDDTLFFHQEHNIVTMAWSPLGQGLNPDAPASLKSKLKSLAVKYDCSPAQLLIAWLLRHPARLYPVLGTTQTPRLREAVDSRDIDLDLQDWFILYEAARGEEVA